MKKKLAYLGLDVHKKSNSAALIPHDHNEPILERRLSGQIHKVVKFAKELSQDYDLRICYEAGCTGFKLYRIFQAKIAENPLFAGFSAFFSSKCSHYAC